MLQTLFATICKEAASCHDCAEMTAIVSPFRDIPFAVRLDDPITKEAAPEAEDDVNKMILG